MNHPALVRRWSAVEVWVNGSIDKALLILKRKMNREGIFGGLRERQLYVKPGDKMRAKRHRAALLRRQRERRDGRARTVSQ